MRTLFRKLGQVTWSFPIILALLVLCVAGLFAITSATYGNDSLKDSLKDAPASQLKYIIIGAGVYLALALTPYQVIVKISPVLYGVGVCLLIACFIPHLGKKTFGAHSWVKIGPLGFEPAEFAKLTYILGMAWFLRVRENRIQSFATVLIGARDYGGAFHSDQGTAGLWHRVRVLSDLLRDAVCRRHARALPRHSPRRRRQLDDAHLLLGACVGPAGAVHAKVSGGPHQGLLRSQPRSQGTRAGRSTSR